jgi:hypothetical protein
MSVHHFSRRVFRAAVSAALLAAGTSASAELIYGVAHTGGQDTLNKLFTFDSATPNVVNDLGNITGLGNLQYLDDIDFRPATGELYGLGYTGSVYKIDINTLVATNVGFVPAPGSGFSDAGIDFNPVSDRLRIIDGQSGKNFAFNPNTGTNTLDSMTEQYVAGDVNAGKTPTVAGIAYNNNVAGALTTTLYGLDIRPAGNPPANTILGTITPPGSGNITTVATTNVFGNDQEGFDISGATGTGYAAFRGIGGDSTTTFYTLNLATGQATATGVIGIDTTNFLVSGIAVAPQVTPPGGGGNSAPLPAGVVVGPVGAALAGLVARRFRKRRA